MTSPHAPAVMIFFISAVRFTATDDVGFRKVYLNVRILVASDLGGTMNRHVSAFGCALTAATLFGMLPVQTEAAAGAASCESLTKLALPNTTITAAQTVAAGAFALRAATTQAAAAARVGRGGAAQIFSTLPAFCRVAATLKPSGDSDIKIEVWLPVSGWNGKFQAIGNGGWAGVISYPALAAGLAGGYATAGTDAGHQGNTAAFALGHPEKLVDMAHRAVHEMTVQAKGIIDGFYGSAPKVSFWNGCSM